MFATPDQIIEAILRRFNDAAPSMGFGIRASAHLPVRYSDVKVPCGRGGDNGAPVSMCMHLCIYVLAHHCASQERDGQMSMVDVGKVFCRGENAALYAVKRASQLLEQEVFAAIYQGALDDINEQGLWLWRAKFTPKAAVQ